MPTGNSGSALSAWQKFRAGVTAESSENMANPKPDTSGLKPFPKGKSGNPGGKTAEQVAIERRNADTAMRVRERLLAAAEAKLANLDSDDAVLEFIEAGMLKLLKDAEDRGLGSPVQSITGTFTIGDALDSLNG